MEEIIEIKPQKGFQEKVFNCTADIAFIGGSAGGGKTSILVMEALKWTDAPDFAGVYFRKDKERIRATGGMLAESKKWYREAELSETILKWRFPSGAQIDFEGIEHMKDLEKWQGAQIPFMVFDEVTEFEEEKFWFMLSRNRGIVRWKDANGEEWVLRPYVRASLNPKPNSWVAKLLEWWIDQDTGYPIEARDGIHRYMVRYQNNIYWGDTKQEVINSCPMLFAGMKVMDPDIKEEDLVKSITFIRGKLSDNKELTRVNPEYYGNLLSLSAEDQARFLDGNWKVSSNGIELYEFPRLKAMFDTKNFILDVFNNKNKFITCDAAKYGQDLCTIYGWQDWTVVAITVLAISDAKDIHREIQLMKRSLDVPKDNILVDQDGIGGDVVSLGGYYGFVARKRPVQDPDTRVVENFDTFKDQCFFKSADKMNDGLLKFNLSQSNVKIFDRGAKNPRYSLMLRNSKNGLTNIKEIIDQHLSSIKKADTVLLEGGEVKYKINSKAEQKEILGGASPDFADPVGMRSAFDLIPRRKGTSKLH